MTIIYLICDIHLKIVHHSKYAYWCVICCNKTLLSVFSSPTVPAYSSVLRHESAHGCNNSETFLHCPFKEFSESNLLLTVLFPFSAEKTTLSYFVYIERKRNERPSSGKTVNLAVADWTPSAAHRNTSLVPFQDKSFSVTACVFRVKYWDWKTTPWICLIVSNAKLGIEL